MRLLLFVKGFGSAIGDVMNNQENEKQQILEKETKESTKPKRKKNRHTQVLAKQQVMS